MASHELLGGLIQVYRRGTGRYWQCSASVKGRQYRVSTGEQDLDPAKQFAEDWYLGLRGKARAGILKTEKTFGAAAAQFEKEYGIITGGQRSERWTEGHKIRIRLHLRPFFGEIGLSEVTPGKVQEYRMHRATTSRTGKPPSRSTLHDEIVTLRLILKTAIRHNWLAHLPDLSPPYRTQGKIVHRPWFSPDEYKQLYAATREYAKVVRVQDKWGAEQVHDFVLFMANRGLRPDEARNLQHRDVTIVKDRDTDQRILEIQVRGKRGVGFCKSMPGAVIPFQRVVKRLNPKPTDTIFPTSRHDLFNTLLNELGLKFDREGQRRTFYSLRHTYICLRLMEGADVYQIAKNCRTSVKMIEDFYASHIKNTVDAAIINVRRPRVTKRKPNNPKARKRVQKRDSGELTT